MEPTKTTLTDIRIKAVLAGAVVDNLATLFCMSFLAAALATTGLPEDEILVRMKSTSGLLLGLIVGLGCTVLGGYTAGRVARQAERAHGALVALAGAAIALAFREAGTPFWFDAVGLAGMPLAGVLGGILAEQRRLKDRTGPA